MTSFTVSDRIRRTGFTLVELVVVLVILGMAASMIAVRYAAPLRHARVGSAVAKVLEIDLFTRRLSRSQAMRLKYTRSESGTHLSVASANETFHRDYLVGSPVQLELLDGEGNRIDEVHFNPGTGSSDYFVAVSEANLKRMISIAGGTGHAETR